MGNLLLLDIDGNVLTNHAITGLEFVDNIITYKKFTSTEKTSFAALTIKHNNIDRSNDFVFIKGTNINNNSYGIKYSIDSLDAMFKDIRVEIKEVSDNIPDIPYTDVFINYNIDTSITRNSTSANTTIGWSQGKLFDKNIVVTKLIVNLNIADSEQASSIKVYKLEDTITTFIGEFIVSVIGVNEIACNFTLNAGGRIVIFNNNTTLYYNSVDANGNSIYSYKLNNGNLVQNTIVNNATLSFDIEASYKQYTTEYRSFPNIIFMGDSITWLSSPRSWVEHFLSNFPHNQYVNVARSGARWTNMETTVYDITSTSSSQNPDSNVAWNQYNKIVNLYDNNQLFDPDVIIMAFGQNDFGYPTGTIANTFSDYNTIIGNEVNTVTDFCTSIRYVVELLRNKFPTTQIIILSPYQRNLQYANMLNLFSMGDRIEDCCKWLSIPIVRMDKELGIYGYKEIDNHIYLYDGLHPNEDGAYLIGTFLASKLLSLVQNKLK